MSVTWHVLIDAPTQASHERVDEIMKHLSRSLWWRHVVDHRTLSSPSIDDGLDVLLPSLSMASPDAVAIADGRIVAMLDVDNLERPADEESLADHALLLPQCAGATSKMNMLLSALSHLCDAPIGTIVGCIACETADGDAHALIVTPAGVRILSEAGHSAAAYSGGWDIEEFPPQSAIPENLLTEDDDWYWSVDLDALKAMLRGRQRHDPAVAERTCP